MMIYLMNPVYENSNAKIYLDFEAETTALCCLHQGLQNELKA